MRTMGNLQVVQILRFNKIPDPTILCLNLQRILQILPNRARLIAVMERNKIKSKILTKMFPQLGLSSYHLKIKSPRRLTKDKLFKVKSKVKLSQTKIICR